MHVEDTKRVRELIRDIGIQNQIVAMQSPGTVSRDVEQKVLNDMQSELDLLLDRRKRG